MLKMLMGHTYAKNNCFPSKTRINWAFCVFIC